MNAAQTQTRTRLEVSLQGAASSLHNALEAAEDLQRAGVPAHVSGIEAAMGAVECAQACARSDDPAQDARFRSLVNGDLLRNARLLFERAVKLQAKPPGRHVSAMAVGISDVIGLTKLALGKLRTNGGGPVDQTAVEGLRNAIVAVEQDDSDDAYEVLKVAAQPRLTDGGSDAPGGPAHRGRNQASGREVRIEQRDRGVRHGRPQGRQVVRAGVGRAVRRPRLEHGRGDVAGRRHASSG